MCCKWAVTVSCDCVLWLCAAYIMRQHHMNVLWAGTLHLVLSNCIHSRPQEGRVPFCCCCCWVRCCRDFLIKFVLRSELITQPRTLEGGRGGSAAQSRFFSYKSKRVLIQFDHSFSCARSLSLVYISLAHARALSLLPRHCPSSPPVHLLYGVQAT